MAFFRIFFVRNGGVQLVESFGFFEKIVYFFVFELFQKDFPTLVESGQSFLIVIFRAAVFCGGNPFFAKSAQPFAFQRILYFEFFFDGFLQGVGVRQSVGDFSFLFTVFFQHDRKVGVHSFQFRYAFRVNFLIVVFGEKRRFLFIYFFHTVNYDREINKKTEFICRYLSNIRLFGILIILYSI